MDNSSLADINVGYAPIQGIRLLPVNFKMISFSFALNVLPYLPLVFTYYSPADLFKNGIGFFRLIKSILSSDFIMRNNNLNKFSTFLNLAQVIPFFKLSLSISLIVFFPAVVIKYFSHLMATSFDK